MAECTWGKPMAPGNYTYLVWTQIDRTCTYLRVYLGSNLWVYLGVDLWVYLSSGIPKGQTSGSILVHDQAGIPVSKPGLWHLCGHTQVNLSMGMPGGDLWMGRCMGRPRVNLGVCLGCTYYCLWQYSFGYTQGQIYLLGQTQGQTQGTPVITTI